MGKSKSVAKRVLVPIERIEQRIYLIRDEKVMLGNDLAELYEVPTKQLNRAVRRNIDRFPADFMFELTAAEAANLRRQSGTSSSHGGQRYRPLAFTEQGVAMLSAVLQSPRAIAVSIEIVRVFVRLRRMLASHAELRRKLDAMQGKYDHQFAVVFDALRQLMSDDERQRRKPPIGFKTEERSRK